MSVLATSASGKKQAHSPEYYRRRRQQLEKGIIQKRHATSTKNNIGKIKRRWTRHCEYLGEDPLQFLVAAQKGDVMVFLEWILDNSKIKKFSSLHENWRQWCQLYRKAVGRSLHAKSCQDINDYMKEHLVARYNLDMSVGEKPVMNVDDLYIVLHHHWTRDATPYPDGRQIIQLAFLLLVSAYTASRPGALVYVDQNERTNIQHFFGGADENEEHEDWDLREDDLKTLCYGQISLILLPNPGGLRDHLVMEIDLKHTKGHHTKPKRKIFLMSEVKQPIFDVIALVLTMAILDDAFSANIHSVEDVFMARVSPPRRSVRLKFKKDKLNVPICRQPDSYYSGMTTHPMKPLRYHTYLYYLQRLSLSVGMIRAMKPYDLRRGTGEAVDKTASLPLLQQVMGHVYASTFQKYMNERVQTHVQASFLGIPSEDALMNILSHQSRYIDPRAPSKYDDLPEGKRSKLSNHPEILKLQQMRDTLAQEAKELYGSMKNASGTKIGELKAKADAALRAAKKNLKEATFTGARNEFFDTIDTLEINKQLDPSLLDMKQGTYEPQRIVHRLKERRRLADLMQIPCQELSEEDDIMRRVVLINALIDLGRVERVPSENLVSKKSTQYTITNGSQEASADEPTRSEQGFSPSPEPRDRPISLTTRHCLFCVFEPNYQCYFASARKAREHFEKHLRNFKRDQFISCPDKFCGLAFRGHQAFKSHAEKVHSIRYFTEAQRIKAGL
ncbi:unnamed protein product [Penicillium nalgiovense]|uniref:C2H2-type domain-containing protein n=1 Tax=Penicillium nalgiovense TaxID=60175 RepID=A0A9W4MLW2_PENNA|nr:unnamed protein product [Penicillium nalgiovense]CAG7938664.1 unnamed protein product [Penicillium nalgiovense]CAG7940930.1 unnamed protein product [Penicillium nalgiovense]CAG7942626.1 unnamed protein product [Penicillium nalgiovense]CAG7957019.1 unnamed protein product [Penicillium nalgiovense]